MRDAVLHRLKSNAPLTALLAATEDDTKIYPHSVEGFGPALAYVDTDITQDGVNVSRFELRAVARTVDEVKALMDAAIKAINTPEDTPGWIYDGVNVLSCRLNGGGALDFDGMGVYERFGYFDVKWKEL